MNPRRSILIFLVAYVLLFFQTGCRWLPNTFGAQVDLLPSVMVYAGLTTGIGMIASLSIVAGLSFDALSANPLGVSILPLFLAGLILFWKRELILKEQAFAQLVLGLFACGMVPVLTVIILLSAGEQLLLGAASAWQWGIMTVVGGCFTPALFWLFHALERAFYHPQATESAFRPDREIKRGRA